MNKKFENKSRVSNISEDEYLKKKEVVTSFFLNKEYMPLTFKQICTFLNVQKNDRELLDKMLFELENEGLVFVDDSKRYALCSKNNVYKCIYEAKSEKFGFGLLKDDDDIFISSSMSLGAMNKDEVLVKILKDTSNSSKRKEGQVIKIVKRNTIKLIGRYIKSINFGFVDPIDSKIADIYIPKKFAESIKDNQMVEVEILKYATSKSKAEGKILSVIGSTNEPNIEVKALYKAYNLDYLEKFNKFVEDEIKEIPEQISEFDKVGRVDRTSEMIYTIDGSDAKDLDDAVCVKKLQNNEYILSVFIADVSHYVKDRTELDKEAVLRGTSTYIPGTVIPMLPKKLSNGICSLNAGVERLSLAIDMKIDKDGNIKESTIYKAVIKVEKKMTYDKVYKVITHQDEEVLEEYKNYEKDIFLMHELALILMAKRNRDGCINFDIPETKVVLDEAGNVLDIKPYEVTIANKIIEEFMLAANMSVAEKFFFLELPFIYRIHEKPDEEKLRALNEILVPYGKKIKGLKNIHSKTLSTIIDEISDEEEKQIISTSMLRTLKLAKYSNECLGHFGLAAQYYCHFTSPIRRYPDLFIHRIISDYLENNYTISDKNISRYAVQSVKYSLSSSEAEKQATLIERDFDDLYKAMYMSKFIGDKFDAIVSSVTSFGIFVKLENTVEGLVPFELMPSNDYFIYDEKRNILVGKESGKVYKVGDKVKVKLERADIKLKRLDFRII